MKKTKTLDELRHHQQHYLTIFPIVKPEAQAVIKAHIGKLTQQINQRV
jgi:hypothetical protein